MGTDLKSSRSEARERVLAGVFSLSSVVASSWIADALNGQCLWVPLIGPCEDAGLSGLLPRLGVSLVLFWVSIVLLYRTAKGLLPVRQLARSPDPHQVLIAAISPLGSVSLVEGPEPVIIDAENDDRRLVLSRDLGRDIEAFTAARWRWSGQQFLRSLRPHRSSLRRLVLIGTSGERGSFQSLPTARALARVYFPEAEIIAHPDPIGKEDIEGLQHCFDEYIQRFQDDGFEQREIILDATGGQKTTSIAAALTTLRWERIEFQYVQTEADCPKAEPRAIGFNLVVDASPRGPGT